MIVFHCPVAYTPLVDDLLPHCITHTLFHAMSAFYIVINLKNYHLHFMTATVKIPPSHGKNAHTRSMVRKNMLRLKIDCLYDVGNVRSSIDVVWKMTNNAESNVKIVAAWVNHIHTQSVIYILQLSKGICSGMTDIMVSISLANMNSTSRHKLSCCCTLQFFSTFNLWFGPFGFNQLDVNRLHFFGTFKLEFTHKVKC